MKKWSKIKWVLILRHIKRDYFICIINFFRPTSIIASHIFGGKNHHPLLWESSTTFRTLGQKYISITVVTNSSSMYFSSSFVSFWMWHNQNLLKLLISGGQFFSSWCMRFDYNGSALCWNMLSSKIAPLNYVFRLLSNKISKEFLWIFYQPNIRNHYWIYHMLYNINCNIKILNAPL